MKSSIFLALAAGAMGAVIADLPDIHKGMTREQEGHKVVASGIAPEVQQLVPLFNDYAPGSKRVKIRYGKFALPSVNATTAMSKLTGEQGTMTTMLGTMKKPCAGDCSLITMQAGLEYANGQVAEPSNGGWLHHIVMLVGGGSRKDSVCSLPVERFFSSGNERTPTAFGDVVNKKVKSSFPLTASDRFMAQLELMNLLPKPQDVWLTVDYEFVDGPRQPGWKVAKAMWLDVTNCGASSVRPPAGKQQFKLAMRPWTSQFDGELLGVGGHLHDGGVNVNVYQNNKVICDSRATYTEPAHGHKVKRDGPHDMNDGMAHIKQMSTCSELGPLKKGDKIFIDANYDFAKFAGMKSKAGAYTEVMGIAILYAAVNL
ncbi:hypothetical protein EJ06DRAFT_130049 [Trichodelitschia bisporula]|uniref:Uncharacterized protein n=1 Tax=Trichodelitschia bisporula TaxID=703511 RepID=A0A6G1HNL0_9PEZI|nr:hypothetical protein EJ06DRAFT_130049 [Trichodelitschia bisporula]